ncbi:hypothetical protein FQR65_LT19127 [Abscondita terminalis]|nr:hypothetical protein FQR65_LT19127 [Abscondita terminalis]
MGFWVNNSIDYTNSWRDCGYRFFGKESGGANLNVGGYTGSSNQKNIFNVIGNQKNASYTASATNLEDELNYTTSEKLTFDFKTNMVTSSGGINNSFKNIDKFKGGTGVDVFQNLNDFSSYNLDVGGSESNTVSYDSAYTALKFTLSSSWRGTLPVALTVDGKGGDNSFIVNANGNSNIVLTYNFADSNKLANLQGDSSSLTLYNFNDFTLNASSNNVFNLRDFDSSSSAKLTVTNTKELNLYNFKSLGTINVEAKNVTMSSSSFTGADLELLPRQVDKNITNGSIDYRDSLYIDGFGGGDTIDFSSWDLSLTSAQAGRNVLAGITLNLKTSSGAPTGIGDSGPKETSSSLSGYRKEFDLFTDGKGTSKFHLSAQGSGSTLYNQANYSFAKIDSGSYYFTFETFNNPRDKGPGMGDPNGGDPNNLGNPSFSYNLSEGVQNLALTSSDDTFSLGKAYMYASGNLDYWIAPAAASWFSSASPRTALFKPGTTNTSVDGGGGLDTYYDEFFTADFKYATGADKGKRVLLNVDWKESNGIFTNKGVTVERDLTKTSSTSSGLTYALYNYTQDLDNSTWNYGNSYTENKTNTTVDDILAKQDDSSANSTDSVPVLGSTIEDSSKEDFANLWQNETEDSSYGNSDTHQVMQEDQEDKQELDQNDSQDANKEEDGENSKEGEESTSVDGKTEDGESHQKRPLSLG